MNIQVLVATMHQTNHSLLEKMNIQTDVVVCNQCDRNEFEEFMQGGLTVKWLSFNERGVGLNRNNALMRATADVVMFADDDMLYIDGYKVIVAKAYEQIPDADVIVFNVKEPIALRYVIPRVEKVGRLNYLRYGTARITARLSSVKLNGIYFNQCFGGGTEYCHGEDNLFLTECLNKGLRIYAYPSCIAELTEERDSSWNKGYDEKYLKDQGVLYRRISRKWWKLLCMQDAVRRSKSYGISIGKAYKLMRAGAIASIPNGISL